MGPALHQFRYRTKIWGSRVTIRCVLMDIEGTIVPIAFVRDVLFPYARDRVAAFLRERREDPAVREWAALCQDTVEQEQ